MTLTTLLTQIEPGDATGVDATLATPFGLAEGFSSSVTALVFPIDTDMAEAGAPDRDQASMEDRTVAHVRSTADRRGIRCEIKARSSFAHGVGHVFADQLRVSDLAVVTWQAAMGVGQRMLLGTALFDSGRPVLVVPHAAPLLAPPSRVLVAWDATPAAVRATHGAMPFITRAAETLVVTVTDDKELRPGQSGIELTHMLARHGATARFTAVRREKRSVLETILATAREAGADMLVMGGLRHAPLRNIVFGSATQDLFDRGPRMATLLAA